MPDPGTPLHVACPPDALDRLGAEGAILSPTTV
jgi:hypothetical protein